MIVALLYDYKENKCEYYSKQKQFSSRRLLRRVKKKMDAFVVKEMLGKNWMLFFFIRMRHIKRGEWKTTTSALIDDTHAHTLYIYMTSRLV